MASARCTSAGSVKVMRAMRRVAKVRVEMRVCGCVWCVRVCVSSLKIAKLYIDGHGCNLFRFHFWACGKSAERVAEEKRLAKLNIVILLLNFPTVSAMSFLTAMCSDIIWSTSALCRDTLSRSLTKNTNAHTQTHSEKEGERDRERKGKRETHTHTRAMCDILTFCHNNKNVNLFYGWQLELCSLWCWFLYR